VPDARIVVLGMMGRTPFAGVAWQVLHYLEGLRRLGCEVDYVEDTGEWPYDPERNTITDDPRYTLAYIRRLLEWTGLSDRWAYVGPGGEPHGPAAQHLPGLYAQADALVNLTGATVLHDEHLAVPLRLYVETDPVLPQIEIALGRPFTRELLAAHTHHFSYGENLGAPDCPVPVEGLGFEYLPTRQPVVLDWWEPPADGAPGEQLRFTTVASWRQTGKDIEWNGETYYWSKDREFLKLLDLPGRVASGLELALAVSDDDKEVPSRLRAHGWGVTDGLGMSREIGPYRDYVCASPAEFTVAKDQNVRLRSGWFSDRTACYLAAGRPAVTQDTAFGNALPVGEGLLAFTTIDEAVAGIEAIESDYSRHARAAAEIAREHFDAKRVLSRMLAAAGL
jgi:hypothetical protein